MSKLLESPIGAQVVFNGKKLDYFAGSGYLGLQNHPEVIRSTIEAMHKYGFSTATSRGGYGEHPLYEAFERQACAYFGAEKVLYFASGYLGMSILTQATSSQFDHIFIDSSAHFSLWDAAHATNMPITPFHHLQLQNLQDKLRNELHPGERPLVLSDGIFPVSGEIAPLPMYIELVRPLHGFVYLDDAHAVGVLGSHGRGLPDYFDIQDPSCFTAGTLSKALGGFGGVIWGRGDWIEAIDRASRIGAGASPPPLVVTAASTAALAVAISSPELRSRLWDNVKLARDGLRDLGWRLADTPVPIICLENRPGVNLEKIRQGLYEQDIAIELVRSYTSTPAGGALRIAIFSSHSTDQIHRLLNAIRNLI